MQDIKINTRRAVLGGCFATVVILAGGWWVGSASGYEAFHLFQTILPTTRSFCSTLMMALATILALMLTLLGLSANLDIKIKTIHYLRIKQISLFITITLIATVLVYLILNIPIVESDEKTMQWFAPLYYGTLAISSILGGAFIAIILLLYNTIRDMINIFRPDRTDDLIQKEEEE